MAGRVSPIWSFLAERTALGHWSRPVAVGLTLPILAVAAAIATMRYRTFDALGYVGIDHAIHDEIAARWLATGTPYLPSQLAGPHDPTVADATGAMASMYPPTVAPLFAAFAILPAIAWWLVPLAVIAVVLARWRPAPWAWPLLAAVLAYPGTPSVVIVGNTTMWVVAGLFAALEWGWPGPLLVLKPSVAPLALVGIRHRGWWITAVALAVVSALFAAEWASYLTAMRNAQLPLAYSLGNLPLLAAPFVAWRARRHPST